MALGNGMYRTTDDGETWQWIGLPESRHINRIWVHPTNADHVYVAALGSVFGSSEDRGVYRTTDGGDGWTKLTGGLPEMIERIGLATSCASSAVPAPAPRMRCSKPCASPP